MDYPEILLKAKQIKDFSSKLPEKGPFGKELISNIQKSIIISESVTSSDISPEAELHENYTDIFIVKQGKEEIFIGGEIADKESVSPGEWRGKTLVKAREYFIEAGDLVIIPKGIAHQHGVGTIKMIVIKIK